MKRERRRALSKLQRRQAFQYHQRLFAFVFFTLSQQTQTNQLRALIPLPRSGGAAGEDAAINGELNSCDVLRFI